MARSDRTSRKDRDSDASGTTAAPARPCPSRFWSRTPQGDAPLQAARNMRQHARTFR